jgi:2Fe-2S type ferredoxin
LLNFQPNYPKQTTMHSSTMTARPNCGLYSTKQQHRTTNSNASSSPRVPVVALKSGKQHISPSVTSLATSRSSYSNRNRRLSVSVHAYSVTVQSLDGVSTVVDVPEGEYILAAALDAGLDMSHDCTMGTCCRCSARLLAGEVDMSAGMIDADVAARGYTLLCIATPKSDVVVQCIDEEELLKEVLDG